MNYLEVFAFALDIIRVISFASFNNQFNSFLLVDNFASSITSSEYLDSSDSLTTIQI